MVINNISSQGNESTVQAEAGTYLNFISLSKVARDSMIYT